MFVLYSCDLFKASVSSRAFQRESESADRKLASGRSHIRAVALTFHKLVRTLISAEICLCSPSLAQSVDESQVKGTAGGMSKNVCFVTPAPPFSFTYAAPSHSTVCNVDPPNYTCLLCKRCTVWYII